MIQQTLNEDSQKKYNGNSFYRCHIQNIYDISGRMALLVTLFLVLVNIFNSVTANSPKAEGKNKHKTQPAFSQLCAIGLTAVETWVVSCILHVFGVLAEYALILKMIQVRTNDIQNNQFKCTSTLLSTGCQQFQQKNSHHFPISYLQNMKRREAREKKREQKEARRQIEADRRWVEILSGQNPTLCVSSVS